MQIDFNQLQRLLEGKLYDRIKSQDSEVSDVDAVEMINEHLDAIADFILDVYFDDNEDSEFDEDEENEDLE